MTPEAPSSGPSPYQDAMDHLGRQIGLLTVELAKRSALCSAHERQLQEQNEQIEFLREQLASRDADTNPTDAPSAVPQMTPSTGS